MAWGELSVERGEEEEVVVVEPCTAHAVLLPFPAYSHVVQILHFARQLVRHHGFTVTLITSSHYYKQLVKAPAGKKNGDETGLHDEGVEILHVSDGLPDEHPRLGGNLMEYVKAVYSMEAGVTRLISELHVRKGSVTCLVRDLHLPFSFQAARDAGIRIAAFAPNSATKEYLNRSVRALVDAGFLPDGEGESVDWERPITCLEGVSAELRVGDLPLWPSVKGKLHSAVVDSIERRVKQYVRSDWVVINTVYELEQTTVDAMRKQTPNVCTVGPLSLADHEDEKCDPWLQDHEARSVIVVAFGTTTVRSIEQFREVAQGLEASSCKFLWVFSPEQVVSDGPERDEFLAFMAAFTERTQGRGRVTSWIPAFLATLRHPAVGAFLTHCGWHSVLESVAAGVPFLTWPFQYDHWPIARCVTSVWRVGLPLEGTGDRGLVPASEVELKVRRLLTSTGLDAEIDAIRARSTALKAVTEKAISKGGSSQQSITSFVAAMRQ